MTLFGGNRSVKVVLEAEIKGYTSKLAAAKQSTLDLAKASQDAAGKHRRSMDDLGNAAARVGLVLGATAAAAVASFAQFDKAMSRAAAGTDATASQMTRLRQAAIAAGRDTQYSATEAADAITAMGKAGVKVGDILSGGLSGALSLAAAGELQVKDAAEIAATAMTQFGLAGKDLPHVADLLAAGAGKAQGNVTDLANALKYVGPVAHGMGISIETTTGILAGFAAQGIIGEQAGTSLRGVLLSLTSPSKIAAAELSRLGITLYDSSGQFLGMENAAGQLQQALGGMTAQQRDASLGVLFGNEQVTAARVLYAGGAKAVTEWTAKVNDSGYAARQAGKLMDNLAGDAEQLRGSLETAFITTGSGANSGLRELTQGVTAAVNAFTSLPGPLQQSTVLVLGVGSAMALLTAGALKGAVGVRTMRTNIRDLGITAARTKTTLVGFGKTAGALGGFELAAAGLGELEGRFASSTIRAGQLQLAFEQFSRTGKTTEVIGDLGRGFGDLGKQLKGLADPSLFQRLNDIDSTVASILTFGQFGSTQGSNPRRRLLADLAAVDQQLADLVRGGQGVQAVAMFEQLNKAAISGGAGVDQLTRHLPAYNDALKSVQASTVGATGATGADALASLRSAKATKDLEDAKRGLKDALDASNNAFLAGREAETSYQAALLATSAAARENGRTLDVYTAKGQANRNALDDQSKAALAYLDTLTDASGAPTAAFGGALARTRAELIKSYRKFDDTKGKAEAYADQILKIPTQRSTDIKLSGIAAARQAIDGFIDRLALVNGKVVTVRVAATSANVREDRGITRANGGITRYAAGGITRYAAGGIENHQAQIAPAGAWRLWAEPETGGEAYIPLAPSKRARSKEILKEVARVLGMTAFADGGISAFAPYSLSDVAQRYQSSIPAPITAKDLAAATDKRKNAVLAEDKAERDLVAIRGKAKHTAAQVQDAEDRLDKARRAAATARANEKQAITRANAPKGFNLADYTKTLGQTVRQSELYRTNLTAIGKRGGDQLVTLLQGMGSEGAQLANALAKASAKDFATVAALLKRLNPEAFATPAAATASGQGITTVRFASGGIEDHSAQYAAAGAYRMWAEPETGGEAYIPLAASKRGRSRMVASDVVQRLGGSVSWSSARARGTSAAPSAAAAFTTAGGGAAIQVDKVQLIGGTPAQVADEFMFKYRARGG